MATSQHTFQYPKVTPVSSPKSNAKPGAAVPKSGTVKTPRS